MSIEKGNREKAFILTTETGAFIRKIYRKNGKRHQTTEKFTKNDEKVILGMIGDFQVYVYPYRFPDKVFIGHFPTNTTIDMSSRRELLSAYNRVSWFLKGEWQNKAKTTIRTQMRRQSILSAYNYGLSAQSKQEKGSFPYNYNSDNSPEQIFKCPFCLGEVWFNTKGELIRHIEFERNKKEISHNPKYKIEECKKWVVRIKDKWKIIS